MDHKAEWTKELRVLLDKVQNHPSADLTAERERIVLLQNLIASHEQKADA
ncbi:hypothetical protein [Sphingomonas immobilis]|uniref:Uncharacterized protein n=1 Tax=Sphingomonas immobilis TaxID=3063997 RepID=A0ABT8ZYZ9_9SPHN|nr:hypothetical protein [Sphingomonas sp. CA1-15]MDO7842799.1 hypothetical protein [Sphingomonas sp. CA1-15]